LNHRRIGARAPHKAFAGGLAEGETKLYTRHSADQGLVDILDGLDEMRLPEPVISASLAPQSPDKPVSSKLGLCMRVVTAVAAPAVSLFASDERMTERFLTVMFELPRGATEQKGSHAANEFVRYLSASRSQDINQRDRQRKIHLFGHHRRGEFTQAGVRTME
jgi:hypothetical protein